MCLGLLRLRCRSGLERLNRLAPLHPAHRVKSLERNILGFVGIAPIHETLIGMVANLSESVAVKQLGRLRQLGSEAA